jgi:hypothetical protein
LTAIKKAGRSPIVSERPTIQSNSCGATSKQDTISEHHSRRPQDLNRKSTAEPARYAMRVRSEGGSHDIAGRIMRRVMTDGDGCSSTIILFQHSARVGSRNVHPWNFVLTRRTTYWKNANPVRSDTRVAACRMICNEYAMSKYSERYCTRPGQPAREFINPSASAGNTLYRGVARGTGACDEGFGRNFAQPFEMPLTVWVGEFFKSWVQGSLSKAAGSVLSLPGGCRFEALAFRFFGQPVGRHRDRVRVGHGGHRARNPCQPACRGHLDFKHFHHAQLIAEVTRLHFWQEARLRVRSAPLS